jgi:hypothetical protein
MQDIAEKLKSFAGQAGEGLNKGLDVLKDKSSQVSDYLQANPTIAAMLLAGGGAGLLGGYLTSQQPEEESESKMQRRGRILRNALLAAAAGAGAVGLGAEGYKRLAEATPANSINPVQEKLTSPFARGAGAVGLGALGFSKGLGMDIDDLAQKARSFLSAEDQLAVMGKSPAEVITYAKTKGFPSINSSNRFLRALGGSPKTKLLAGAGAAAGYFAPEMIGGVKDLFLQE